MDAVDEIIAEALHITNFIAENSPDLTLFAVQQLLELRHRLATAFPDHPALKRVDKYIDRLGKEQTPGPDTARPN